jgi:hypothetical protein
MSVRTPDAGTPPPERPPESIHASTFAPDTFFAYAVTPDRRSTVSLGKGPPTDPGSDGHGAVASTTVTGATGVDVVDVGVEGNCVTSDGAGEVGSRN